VFLTQGLPTKGGLNFILEAALRRCPNCHRWISKKATSCKHCKISFVGETDDDRAVASINKAFAVIEEECAKFEYTIDCMIGGYFRRHEYTEEELLYSPGIDNIKAVASKIGNYIGNLEIKGLLSKPVRNYYENKIEILRQRMAYIFNKIKSRRKTFWDCGKDMALSSYYFILNIGFYHFKNVIIPEINRSGKFAGIFNTFGQATKGFEDFLWEARGKDTDEKGREDRGGYAESKRA
jgi:hypothetical protein